MTEKELREEYERICLQIEKANIRMVKQQDSGKWGQRQVPAERQIVKLLEKSRNILEQIQTLKN